MTIFTIYLLISGIAFPITLIHAIKIENLKERSEKNATHSKIYKL